MSTDLQDRSPEQQRQAIEELAKEQGYVLGSEDWYCDEGISGNDTAKRLSFLEMHAACVVGKYDVILCWDTDRFGRMPSDEVSYYTFPLREAGVNLHTCTDGFLDLGDEMTRIMLTLKSEQNHQYLVKLSGAVDRGMKPLVEAGIYAGGPIPLGYALGECNCDQSNGRRKHSDACTSRQFVLGPEHEQSAVRDAFEAYAAGGSLASVKEMLYETYGIKRSLSGVRDILSNPHYCGDYTRDKTVWSKFKPKRKGVKVERRPRKDWTVIMDNHVAIVSRELFDTVQSAIHDKNRFATGPRAASDGKIVLNGILRCGKCGSRMNGMHDKRLGTVQYVCTNNNKSSPEDCEEHSSKVQQNEILPGIIAKLREQLCTEAHVRTLADAFMKAYQSRSKTEVKVKKSDVDAMEKKLKSYGKRLAEEPPRYRKYIYAEIDDLERKIDTAKEALRSNSKKPIGLEDCIASAAHWVRSLESSEPKDLRGLLKTCIDSITVDVEEYPSNRAVIARYHKTNPSGWTTSAVDAAKQINKSTGRNIKRQQITAWRYDWKHGKATKSYNKHHFRGGAIRLKANKLFGAVVPINQFIEIRFFAGGRDAA